ncbi:MAG: hypothetical protein CVV41_05600 [Candidatus Riflebacteria bacterium HGW-Riflebacteria-1]|jgi:hypothetical protein|nr:MAG: hypothetical protein CVV41_05600 [Candidatus Riflebacteria bacterium HGW-Riflebacteria-1]
MHNDQIFVNPCKKLAPAANRPNLPIEPRAQGKIYADVPLNFFADIDSLKNYVGELKSLGVNVLLILPHFMPGLSAYVVRDYEQPCPLFGTWEAFADFMLYVKDLGMDRMIDIPFNHADWQVANLKRGWFKKHEAKGIEAGADDEDADGNRVRINWGAYELDNSNHELQNYWLEKVIFSHVEKLNVNAIRIDAAWGLDKKGLKHIVGETRRRFPHVWFLAENLGMARLVKLAESSIAAGAQRFFNNIYWYTGGVYIPADIYRLYKRSGGVPTCSIYSSHDTLMPAMKALARVRSAEVKGLNDKAIVRKFVQYEKLQSLRQLDLPTQSAVIEIMKLDFALAALMSSDLMFAAGSERALFERIDVLRSGPTEFARGIDSDLPQFISEILQIKFSHRAFNCEGVVIPFGSWQTDKPGIRGYVKSLPDGSHAMVAVNSGKSSGSIKLPRRMRLAAKASVYAADGHYQCAVAELPATIELKPGQILILLCQ